MSYARVMYRYNSKALILLESSSYRHPTTSGFIFSLLNTMNTDKQVSKGKKINKIGR